MLMLQVHRRITARELARRLEVSERTIQRDMDALGAAGVPVLAERGPQGGWSLAERYRTDLNGLNEAEMRALFLMHSPRILADLGIRPAAEAGIVKLLAALPAMARGDAEHARRCIHIDGAGWKAAAEQVPLLPTLHDAVWEGLQVVISYERGDGVLVERRVHPLGLVAKGSIWYMVAAVDGEPRTYRVSRVRGAQLLGEAIDRPAGFDLAEFWEASTRSFSERLPRYPAVLRLHHDAIPLLHMARYTRVERLGEPDETGWLTAEVLFEVPAEALAVTLGLGALAEVLEPAELREQVRGQVAGMARRYGFSSCEGA
jgi:predicted DNA-binding transcriptional regulator YafY